MRSTCLAIAVAVLALGGMPPSLAQAPAAAPAPHVVLQGADFHRIRVGAITVTALSDGTVPQDLHVLLRNTTTAKTDARLHQSFLRNPIEASINAFLIPLPDRLALVDTGAGELFGPGNGGKLLESLAAAGYRPEAITDVLITHVHTDHSGGLVRDGRLAFPNATVHVGKPDVDFFLDVKNAAKSGYDRRYFEQAIATLKPYVDAGRLSTFYDGTEVLPGITATLHPGHTPGSAFFTLASEGESITFIGDLIHVAAVQFADPRVTIVYDVDAKRAQAAREQAFARLAAERALMAAPHLPFPGIGHIRRAGKGYRWIPMEYTNRQAG